MTNERSEHLDDTIDRVAAGLTFVSHDAGFARRIADRLDDRPTGWWFPSRAAIAVAAAAIVMVLARTAIDRLTPTATAPPPHVTSTEPARVPTAAAPPAIEPGTTKPAAPLQASAAPARAAERPRFITHERVVPQIAALAPPAPLGVDVSSPMPYPVPLTISPVELAPLGLADLELTESGVPENPKE